HHRGRLDDGSCALAGLQAERIYRFPGHDRYDPRRLGYLDLDLGEESLDLDGLHDAAEAVASAQPVRLATAQSVDLGSRDEAPVRTVALGSNPAVAIPAPERVERDSERPCSLTRRVELL